MFDCIIRTRRRLILSVIVSDNTDLAGGDYSSIAETEMAKSGHSISHNLQTVHASKSTTLGRKNPRLSTISDFFKTPCGQTEIQM